MIQRYNQHLLVTVISAFFLLRPSNFLLAQKDSLRITLKEAIEYAMVNNSARKNSIADIAMARQTVREVTSIGLPQASINLGFQDNLEKPVFIFPDPGGVPTPIRVGNKYQNTAALGVNMILLDGTFLLGLKAAKQYTILSERMAEKTESDLKADIAKSYVMALIARENISLVEENYKTLEEIFLQTEKLYNEGFAEKLEADRFRLQLSNLGVTREKLKDQWHLSIMMLKSKLGMDTETPVVLTDKLNDLNERFVIPEADKLDETNRIEFKLLEQQKTLNEYNINRYRYASLPSLSGFYNYQQSNFGETYDLSRWYSNSLLGFNLRIPLFAGFGNSAKVQKARIELYKTENDMAQTKHLLQVDFFRSKSNYLRARESVNIQNENLTLANEIFKITAIKYQQGVGSNLEVSTAQQDLKTAQTNYLNSLYDLIVAKIELQIAGGGQLQF